jgi:hypothetical protein
VSAQIEYLVAQLADFFNDAILERETRVVGCNGNLHAVFQDSAGGLGGSSVPVSGSDSSTRR